MTAYEYRVEVIPNEPERTARLLTEWGSQGWRVVTAHLIQARTNPLQPDQVQHGLHVVLERPRDAVRIAGAGGLVT